MKIDREDSFRVSLYNWRPKGKYYKVCKLLNGEKFNVYLHHFLIGTPVDRRLEIDHINLDGGDNRKKNLRFVTKSQNKRNNKGKGYYWNKQTKKYHSQMYFHNKNYYLGSYKTEKEAKHAYENFKESIKEIK